MRVAFLALLTLAALPAADVRVRLVNKTVNVPLEQYVAAVLAAESNTFRSDEALKAMAVAARTYAVRFRGRHAAEGFDLCSSTHCQVMQTRSIEPRYITAAEATAGELAWFDGKPILATYSQECGGRSEAGGLPYLKIHDDPYCSRSPWEWRAAAAEIQLALTKSGLQFPQVIERIAVSARTASGRPKTLTMTGQGESVMLSATSFRFAMGRNIGWNTVRSDRWDVRSVDGAFRFDGIGGGHGVGLCQLGADRMGADGSTYREILAFYYPGSVVGLTAQGLNWTRMGGVGVTLLTARPDRDRALLRQAEKLGNDLKLRNAVEIRVYPDVETYRNATGESGSVAGFTAGHRIHLQPATASTTIRHELLHVSVEEQAAPGLPLWFREGLVAVLAHEPGNGTQAVAAKRVSALVTRYGEVAVLDWLRNGLPPELKNASVRLPATNSR